MVDGQSMGSHRGFRIVGLASLAWLLSVGACNAILGMEELGPLPTTSAGGGIADGGGGSGASSTTSAGGMGGEGGSCVAADCPDPGDCVAPICVGGQCDTENESAGTACTSGGELCDGDGACVECLMHSDCTEQSNPVCKKGLCIPPGCDDEQQNQDETDVDCGGGCPPCSNTKSCVAAEDCKSGYCYAKICVPCMTSSQCSADKWCDPNLDGGSCVADLMQGAACYEDAQCSSPACVDGFCCDSTCGGTCQACSKAKTGQSDATCANIPAATDPDNECTNGLCDGSGACMCALQMALGQWHTCARKHDDTLWCWGGNYDGQLGDGTTVDKSSPVQVTSLGSSVVEVALGIGHTCARKQDGTLWCWGGNGNGELGDGTTVSKSSPVQVTALGAAVAGVALGSTHTCARKQNGTLWCWGRNLFGQVGDGTNTDKHNPVQVPLLTAVVEVSLGYGHTCARKQDGTLWCWGSSQGQQNSPIQITALGSTVTEVGLGGEWRNCARQQDGTLWCWTENPISAKPVQVSTLGSDVVEVALGYYHTCVRKQDGTPWCWGDNIAGQLGDGTTANKSLPTQVPLCP